MSPAKVKRRKIRNFIIIGLVFAVLVAIGFIVGANTYYKTNLKPVSSTQSLVEVVIPSGATLNDVSTLLKEKRLIRDRRVFEQYVRNNGVSEDIKAGTYELSPSYGVPEIVSILTNGKIVSKLVTILPGSRIDQVKKTLLNAGFSEAEVNEALDPSKYTNHPALVDKPKSASLEGYLYPESFQRDSSTSATDIVTKSLNEMQKRLTPDVRSAFAARGLSVYKAIILASIVEKEVSNETDRAKVAQVFLARLDKGIKLQSDATAKYGAVLAGRPDLDYANTLTFKSAYNTYNNQSLPPTPISNVSESSLRAVADPAKTDYLYFVSGDDGVTYFSKTLQEHEALTATYCKKLCGAE